jgi:hypothetical protein
MGRRPTLTVRWIIAVAFATTLASAGAADAGSLRITVGSPSPRVPPRGFIVQDRGGLQVFNERRLSVVPAPNCYDHTGRYVCGGRPPGAKGAPNCYDHLGRYVCGGTPPAARHHHQHKNIVVPQPVYVVPSRNCFVPGYWHTHWLPQHTLYNVWVPAQWAADGSWVDGHYEQQPYVSGYVPQYTWVPDHWSC